MLTVVAAVVALVVGIVIGAWGAVYAIPRWFGAVEQSAPDRPGRAILAAR